MHFYLHMKKLLELGKKLFYKKNRYYLKMQGVTSLMYFGSLFVCDLVLSSITLLMTFGTTWGFIQEFLNNPKNNEVYYTSVLFLGTLLWNATFIAQSNFIVLNIKAIFWQFFEEQERESKLSLLLSVLGHFSL